MEVAGVRPGAAVTPPLAQPAARENTHASARCRVSHALSRFDMCTCPTAGVARVEDGTTPMGDTATTRGGAQGTTTVTGRDPDTGTTPANAGAAGRAINPTTARAVGAVTVAGTATIRGKGPTRGTETILGDGITPATGSILGPAGGSRGTTPRVASPGTRPGAAAVGRHVTAIAGRNPDADPTVTSRMAAALGHHRRPARAGISLQKMGRRSWGRSLGVAAVGQG